MGYKADELFEQDLSKMDYMQLAEWITACNDEVEIIRDLYKNDDDYFEALSKFQDAWVHHYEQNQSLYRSKKFQKARLFTTYRGRVQLKVDYGTGRKSIQIVPFDTYENIQSSSSIFWKPEVFETIEQTLSLDYQKILNVFLPENIGVYKELLHEVIADQTFTKIDIKVRFLNEKNKKLTQMTYKEFVDVCEKNDTYEIKPVKHTRRSDYNAALDDCWVTSSIYHDFHKERTSHKDFDKKFFINLAFALALPYQSVVRLLAYNGYTLNSAGRVFDEICKKAFKLGFSRKLTNELIKMKNAELAKGSMAYNPVPTLDKLTTGKSKNS